MAPVSTSHDGVMWVHSNLLEDEQWTKITSKKKKNQSCKEELEPQYYPFHSRYWRVTSKLFIDSKKE